MIVLWAFVTGGLYARLVGFRQARTMLLAGLTLYLATYTQHAGFYDTRFAALGIALFALGLESRRNWLTWTGYLLTLASRETAVLLLLVMIALLPVRWIGKRERLWAIGIATVWFLGSVITMLYLGGPVSMGRFAPCLTAPSISPGYAGCLASAVATDWPLKLGYSLRLLLFGGFAIRTVTAPLSMAPDLLTVWLSKDNVLYSLSWHYYIPTLTVALVMGALALQRNARQHRFSFWVLTWFVATGLWQFVTTFHPRLF